MNVINPEASELMLSSLKSNEVRSRPVVADKGETLVIEGRYVSVNANNQIDTNAPTAIVPNWLVSHYA